MTSRVYRPPPAPRPEKSFGEELILPSIDQPSDCSDDRLANAIAEVLQEQKPQIIRGVLQVLGREKALSIYEETRDIEKKGGMIIVNGERRRTSGGVYLQLVKKEGLSKEQMSLIFPPDEAHLQWRKRKRAVHRKRNRENRSDNTDRQGSEAKSSESSTSRLSDRVGTPKLLHNSDSNDATDADGSKCPGSTPITTPGPTPTSTPIVTPHCSDDETDTNAATGTQKIVDTALAIVKAAGSRASSHAPYDEDFLDTATAAAPPADEMDVF